MGSRSTITARGTIFPELVSLKNVLKQSFVPDNLSDGIVPSGCIPCSRQYSSQQELPICTPACPTCIDIHSRCKIIIFLVPHISHYPDHNCARKKEEEEVICFSFLAISFCRTIFFPFNVKLSVHYKKFSINIPKVGYKSENYCIKPVNFEDSSVRYVMSKGN